MLSQTEVRILYGTLYKLYLKPFQRLASLSVVRTPTRVGSYEVLVCAGYNARILEVQLYVGVDVDGGLVAELPLPPYASIEVSDTLVFLGPWSCVGATYATPTLRAIDTF